MKKVCCQCGVLKAGDEFFKERSKRCKQCVAPEKYGVTQKECVICQCIPEKNGIFRVFWEFGICWNCKDIANIFFEKMKPRFKGRMKGYKGKWAGHEERTNLGSCTWKEFKECIIFFGFKDPYTGLPLDIDDIHIDHIIPVIKGGSNNINNLLPCASAINKSKRAQDWEEWYPKQPFYSKEREKKIREWIELKTK